MKVRGQTLQACLLLSIAVAVQCVMNETPRRKDQGWRLQRSGPPRQLAGPPGHPGPPGVPMKRIYHSPMSMPMPKYGPPSYNPHRRQYPQKMRYGPPKSVRGPPPPGWKSKRVGGPPNFPPPRKVRNPKPHKYQKPFNKRNPSPKVEPFGSSVKGAELNQQAVDDSYGQKTVYKVHKVPQTTYGIPHPTQGSPEPPKSVEEHQDHLQISRSHQVSPGAATSFVHVFQGDNDKELDTKTSYTFGSNTAGYAEHKGKVYDEESKIASSEPKPKKVGFTPPKQTFGFQPYDDKDHFSLTPSHSFFSVSSQQSVDSSGQDSLSHNYFDQKS